MNSLGKLGAVILAFAFLSGCVSARPKPEVSGITQPGLEPGQRTQPQQLEGPVRLEILSPTEGQVLDDDDFEVHLRLAGYQTGRDWQHVLVFVDDQEPVRLFDLTQPLEVEDLEPGAHLIRAFPVRAWGESIKDETAFAMVKFYVEEREPDFHFDPKAPILTLSAPIGEQSFEEGAPARVLFDFHVKNAKMDGEYKINWTIDDGPIQTQSTWAPLYLEGLAPGRHTIEAWLQYSQGEALTDSQRLSNPYWVHHVMREFKIHER